MQNNIQFNSSAVNAGDCVGNGWSYISPNYGMYIGMTVVFGIIVFIVSLIPYIGGIVNQFLAQILLCGFFMAILTNSRDQSPDFSMLFEGFSKIGACCLLVFIQMVPVLLLSLAMYGILFGTGILNTEFATGSADSIDFSPFANSAVWIPLAILYVLILLMTFVIKILFYFALPLIADRDLGAIEAISLSIKAASKNLGGLILLFILEILIMLGGFLALCIGLLFVIPIVFAAEIAAYRAVFPDSQSMFNNVPPRPDEYGGNFGTPQNFQ